MLELDIITFYDRLKNKWETKKGLFLTLLITVLLSLGVIELLISDSTFKKIEFYIYGLIGLLLISTCIYWVIDTNRFFLKRSDKITAGIVLIVDEEQDKLIVRKIVRKVIENINSSKSFSNLNLRLLPTNFVISDNSAEKYHKDFNFLYDLIIRLTVESGKYESIEKIEIAKLSTTFKSKYANNPKKIYSDIVDLSNDMDLQIKVRNWSYELVNSGKDKKKYFENLHHILLYYVSFYAIYSDRNEDALKIMTLIFNPQNAKILIQKKEDNKTSFQFKPINLAESRIASILINLFFTVAIKKHEEKKPKEALDLFRKLENIIENHPQKFGQYIGMARYSYELGLVEDSIKYTQLARKISPKSLEVYLNLAFFSIIKDEVENFCKYYQEIVTHADNDKVQWMDTLEFLEIQRGKFKGKEKYFKFSTLLIEYLFIDSSKKNEFKETVNSYKEDKKFNDLYFLGNRVLNLPAKVFNKNIKNSKRKKKIRKKKKKK